VKVLLPRSVLTSLLLPLLTVVSRSQAQSRLTVECLGICASGLAKVLRVRAADASWFRVICFGLATTAARIVDTWQWNVPAQ
jgi:hypothetical protein